MFPKSFDQAHGKRILIFSLAYYPMVGGAEIAVREITSRISDIEFDLVTLRFSKKHPAKEKIGNCTVYRINSGPGYLGKIFFVPFAAFHAIKLNKDKKYDALWAIMTNMLFPIVLMRLLGNRTPYILTLQDGDPFEYVFQRTRIKIFMPLLKYGFSHADKVQAISSFLANWARQMGYRGRVEVIPNGVDVKKFEKTVHLAVSPPSEVTLVTTSRLVEKNAVGDIIEAFKFLPDNVSLEVLGAGPLEEVLRSKVKSLNLGNRVEFLGNIPHYDIPKYLNAADIFVRPSLSEGMGNSFIEAMAAGLPVIATPVGGIPDFLKHEETGLFCEVRNPKSIAEQVERLITDEPLRNKLIANAKKMVEEKYDWDLIAEEMRSKVFNL
ncbi:MAG: glycosyltransferase family 4 protein [bacterium]|nr:glycosyltransferase family 4 protein [bacterium]